jgi:tyrosine-specific transport protein
MNRFGGSILLVSGMAIGTGMLALPVVTAFAGFYPTLLLLLVCWFFMLMTGLMLVDVNYYTGLNTNLISMSEKTLGKPGKVISWFCYLFLFYSIQAAHIAASGPVFAAWFPFLPSAIFPLGLIILFGGFIYAGTKYTDGVNRLAFLGIALGYLLLILFAPSHVDVKRISHIDFKPLLVNIPIVLTSFGFQNIVPTLYTYLQGDRKKIRLAITIGSFLPFLLFAFWDFIVLGSIPLLGKGSLSEAYSHGVSATVPLMNLLKTPLIQTGTSIFSFCAILTSFLGISIALIDFLIDGLKLSKNKHKRSISFFLTFLFPVLFVYLFPEGFLFALNFAGIIAIILVGIIPCLMTFSLEKSSFWKSANGRILLFSTMAFFFSVLGTTILLKLGFFQSLMAPYLS